MKSVVLFASFFVPVAVFAQNASPGRHHRLGKQVHQCVYTTTIEPVGERVETSRSTVEGALLRLVTAPNPVQMFSPFAPPEYGSGRSLVTYTDRKGPFRNSTQNATWFQPEGLRLLTLRPFP